MEKLNLWHKAQIWLKESPRKGQIKALQNKIDERFKILIECIDKLTEEIKRENEEARKNG